MKTLLLFPSPFSVSPCPAPQGQRGAVLIIALIMLLILTLIGVAGLRDTQLQERMAGGAQDRERALQAAEAALREAETEVSDGAYTADIGDNYKDYNGADPASDLQRKDAGNNPVTEVEYWRDHYAWNGAGKSQPYSIALDGVAALPQYVIELLPSTYSPIPGSTNAGETAATGVPTIKDYLITVRGTGSTPDSVVILQSQYRFVSVTP